MTRIERRCLEKGLRMTDQRRTIARVISEATDHPDVETVYERAAGLDPRIGLATVYRTLRLFEEASILEKHDFGDGRARYEEAPDEHHDHLIDVHAGKVIEFTSPEIEALQRKIAAELGYRLVDHRLELYGVPLDAPTRDEVARDDRARDVRALAEGARTVSSSGPATAVPAVGARGRPDDVG